MLKPQHLGNNSTLIRHESCPECPSSDAFAVYSDGHGFCYSCKYFKPSSLIVQLEQQAQAHMESMNHNPGIKFAMTLPPDVTKTIPAPALAWLDKYGITREEIINNEIQWSPSRDWLVFPVRDEKGNLMVYQARLFNSIGARWLTFGEKSKIFHLIGLRNDPKGGIVLVEDIVSAIKVGRHATAMPLMGSNCGPATLTKLKYLTKKLIVWLDSDKWSDAVSQIALRSDLLGMDTSVIYTEKDPKEQDDKTIQSLLRNL